MSRRAHLTPHGEDVPVPEGSHTGEPTTVSTLQSQVGPVRGVNAASQVRLPSPYTTLMVVDGPTVRQTS